MDSVAGRAVTRRTLGWTAVAGGASTVVLAGCAGPGAEQAGPAQPGAPAGEVEAWTRHTGARGQWFEGQLVPAFTAEHPGVRVKHVAVGNTEEFYEKLIAAVAGGVAPGFAQMKVFWVPDLGVRGVLAPLDGLVTRSKVVRPDLYLKFQWDSCKWDGALYAVPMYAGATNLFVNAGAAREVGSLPCR